MAEKIRPKPSTIVRQTTHPGDTRPNIPTAELESFARPDEQDSKDLEGPAVPIYIQETIDPLALVEELRAESEGLQTEQQLGLWEMTWSFSGPDGRATFEWVEIDSQLAVRWRRIGGHEIFKSP